MKTSQKNNTVPSAKDEVRRILKTSKNKYDNLSEDSSIFVGKFLFNLLKEDENLETTKNPEQFDPETNKMDFEDAMEPSTPEGQFDVQGIDPDISSKHIEAVNNWTTKLKEFKDFLNNPDTQNLHKILAVGDKPKSLLRGITRKTSDSITRIAGEIGKVEEVLHSYVNMAPKKMRDNEQAGSLN